MMSSWLVCGTLLLTTASLLSDYAANLEGSGRSSHPVLVHWSPLPASRRAPFVQVKQDFTSPACPTTSELSKNASTPSGEEEVLGEVYPHGATQWRGASR